MADEPWPGLTFTCLPSVNSLFVRILVVDEELKIRSNNICRDIDGKRDCSTAWLKKDLDLAEKDHAYFDENARNIILECDVEDNKSDNHKLTLKTNTAPDPADSGTEVSVFIDNIRVYVGLFGGYVNRNNNVYDLQTTIDYVQGNLRVCTFTTGDGPPSGQKHIVGDCQYK